MSVRKVKGYWTVSYRDEKGKARTRTFGKGRKGKDKAEGYDLEVKYKKAKGEPLPMSRMEGVYLDELAQMWVDEKKAQGRKAQWLRDWARIFNVVFLAPLTKKPAHQITQADVLAVVGANYAEASQSTRNRYIGYIKSMFEYGVEHGHIAKNPLASWKKGKERRRESKLTLDDLRNIQAAAMSQPADKRKRPMPHLAWAIECAWNVPCRPGPSDLFALKFSRVNWSNGGVTVYHSKVDKEAWIPCSEQFMLLLWEKSKLHRSGHLIEYAGRPVKDLGKSLNTAAERAGLGYQICMYDIRHLWITTMLNQGVEPSTIAHMAGTSVRMIVSNYYEPQAEKDRAVGLLPSLSTEDKTDSKKVVNIASARGRLS